MRLQKMRTCSARDLEGRDGVGESERPVKRAEEVEWELGKCC